MVKGILESMLLSSVISCTHTEPKPSVVQSLRFEDPTQLVVVYEQDGKCCNIFGIYEKDIIYKMGKMFFYCESRLIQKCYLIDRVINLDKDRFPELGATKSYKPILK